MLRRGTRRSHHAEQSKDDVLSVITQIVSEESGVAAKDITRETTFAQDLDVDSLGLLTIATQVDQRSNSGQGRMRESSRATPKRSST